MNTVISNLYLHLRTLALRSFSFTRNKNYELSKNHHFYENSRFKNSEKFNNLINKNVHVSSKTLSSHLFFQNRPDIENFEKLNIEKSVFFNCSSQDSGGAIFVEKTITKNKCLSIDSCFFSDCFAVHMGGCIYLYEGDWNITNTCFQGSYSDRGATMYMLSKDSIYCCLNLTSMVKNGYGQRRERFGTFVIESNKARIFDHNSSLNICAERAAVGQAICEDSSILMYATLTDCNGYSGYYSKSNKEKSLHSFINGINITRYRGWEGVLCSMSVAIFTDLIITNSSSPFLFSSFAYECIIKDSFFENITETINKTEVLHGKWKSENVMLSRTQTHSLQTHDEKMCSNFLLETKITEIIEEIIDEDFDELALFLTNSMKVTFVLGLILLIPCSRRKQRNESNKKPVIPLPRREE